MLEDGMDLSSPKDENSSRGPQSVPFSCFQARSSTPRSCDLIRGRRLQANEVEAASRVDSAATFVAGGS